MQDVVASLLTLTLLLVVLFWRLGVPTFWDPDEAHYAETTREMIATGDWWAAYYNDEPFFDKPVLFHQLQGLAMLSSTDPELGARLVPAMAALALVGVTAWLGAVLAAPRVGLTAAALVAANPGVFALSRYAILDTAFTLALFGGAAALAVSALRDRPRLQWLGYIALAMAVLIKGPLALALSGLTFVLLLAVSADLRRRLLSLNWIAGLTLIVALAAPWFVYMYLRFGHDFVNGYILDENVRLFAASRFANQPGYSFYFEILAVGMLPWTVLLAGRAIDDVIDVARGKSVDPFETMLWTWTVTIVGFFTLSTFKLDHYVFPAAPALCLLAARAWTDTRPATRVARHSVGPLLVVAGAAIAYLMMVRLALPPGAAIVPAALILCGGALTIAVARKPPTGFPWLAIAPLVALYAGVVLYVLPALEARKVIPDIAGYISARAAGGDRIASYRLNRWTPAYRFYVGRHTTFLDDPAQAVAFFSEAEPFYAAMRRDGFDELVARGAPLRIAYERAGMAVTSGRVLWRTPEPPVSYVVAVKR